MQWSVFLSRLKTVAPEIRATVTFLFWIYSKVLRLPRIFCLYSSFEVSTAVRQRKTEKWDGKLSLNIIWDTEIKKKSELGNLFIYLAGCTMFPHLPAPIKQFDHYIIFLLQLFLSFQSSSIDPFSPIIPLIPSAQVSLGLPRLLLPSGRHFITSFGNYLVKAKILFLHGKNNGYDLSELGNN
jgi:hypothetical protein